MTTRDPATSPRVGDVWEDGYGSTMTVVAFRVGYLTTNDVIVTNIDGYPFDYTPEHFANMVRHGHLIRVDGEQQHL